MVVKETVYIPCFQDFRTLHIYLPKDYENSSSHYPVFYMFDGHNLFYDEDATYGKSWRLKDFLDAYSKELIIVGLECNHEGNRRLNEFSPYDFHDHEIGYIHGEGDALMQWITHQLKPWVDERYRTKVAREFTGIGGSSMGGFMSLYAILRYNTTFSMAACLSPFLFAVKHKIDKEIKKASLDRDTRIYISWGSNEFSTKLQLAKGASLLCELAHSLLEKHASVYPNLVVKGSHCEASWKKEIEYFLSFLLNH